VGVNGYQRPPLKLTFDAPELEGLEVFARRLTVAETRTLWDGPGVLARVDLDHAIEAIVAGAIRSWNYTDEDGEPVEPTAENLDSRVDGGLVGELVGALLRASTQVAPPLSPPSDGGSPSEEGFSLMADLSSGPASSPGPS
jgi:hypothetical protein